METARSSIQLRRLLRGKQRAIVRAVERGSSIRAAARRFAVSPSAAIKLMQRVRATGSAAPARFGGHRRPLLAPFEADLKRLVEATPDLSLVELQAALQQRCGLRAGLSTLHKALRRIGLRHKKKALRAAEQDRHPASARLAAAGGPGTVDLPGRDCDHRRHGAALRPQPARRAPGRGRAPGALEDRHLRRRPAPDQSGIIAPLVLDGRPAPPSAPTTSSSWRRRSRTWRRRGARQPRRPQGRRGRQALAAAGTALLFLPPYSPDFNPIEQLLAKLKCAAAPHRSADQG
jgi:transposase